MQFMDGFYDMWRCAQTGKAKELSHCIYKTRHVAGRKGICAASQKQLTLALGVASWNDHADCAAVLLEAGAHPLLRYHMFVRGYLSDHQWSAFHFARAHVDGRMIRTLVCTERDPERDPDFSTHALNVTTAEGIAVLSSALKEAQTAGAVVALVAAGARLDGMYLGDLTALMAACNRERRAGKVAALLRCKARVDVRNFPDGLTALHWACSYPCACPTPPRLHQTVRQLLRAKADANARTTATDGMQTPYDMLCMHGTMCDDADGRPRFAFGDRRLGAAAACLLLASASSASSAEGKAQGSAEVSTKVSTKVSAQDATMNLYADL